MLSYTFIDSHSQLIDPGPEGRLVSFTLLNEISYIDDKKLNTLYLNFAVVFSAERNVCIIQPVLKGYMFKLALPIAEPKHYIFRSKW